MQRGSWVTDSIQLKAPIAEGAMGRVWVAHHHRLHTDVAVKFVSDKLGDDREEALARFDHEAKLAAQIKSPHVVQTFDSGLTNEGIPYIVMELLEGESLGERLRRAGRLNLGEATLVVQHTARALTAAHGQGIVHRDIKPDNIFMCRTDEGTFCKVLDFGIAKQTRLPAMGGLTTDGKMVGTPEYMSPEQVLEDRPVDYRADLWALSVVLYQGLTGQLPFNGATLGQLCLNLVGKRPPAPTKYRPDLPNRVDTWFARALNRDPQMRFSSAQQMADGFATLEDDLHFHAIDTENTERHLSSTSTLRRIQAPSNRSTMLTAAGAAAAVAVLGGGSWLIAAPSSSEPLILAQRDALAPVVTRVANRAIADALTPPRTDNPTTQDDKSGTEPKKPAKPKGTTPKNPTGSDGVAKPKPKRAKAEPAPTPRPAGKPPKRNYNNSGF